MKKRTFDILMILSIGLLLTLVIYFGWMTEFAQFALIPMLACYYIGQYAGRRFSKEK